MRPGSRGVIRVFLTLAVLFSSAGPSMFDAQGQGVDETLVNEWVETDLDVVFPSFDRIEITANYEVFEVDLGQPAGIPASTIRHMMLEDVNLVETLSTRLRSGLWDTVNDSLDSLDLANSTIVLTGPVLTDNGTDVPGDPYRGPIVFQGSATVHLGPGSIGLPVGSDLSDLIEGTLKMEGVLNLTFALSAEAGHLNRFKFVPPTGHAFKAGQAMTSVQEVPVDGRNSTTSVSTERYLVFASVDPVDLDESIEARIELDCPGFDDVHITVNISIAAVSATEVSPYFPDVLGLTHISADGIRMAVENGLMSWDDIYGLAVRDEVRDTEMQLSSLMAEDVHLDFTWVAESLTGYDLSDMTGRPVRATLVGKGSFDTRGMSKDVTMAALMSGAKVPFDIGISSELDWEASVRMPKGTTIEGTGMTPSTGPDGRQIFVWDRGRGAVKGSVVAIDPNDHAYDGRMSMDIRVKDYDASVGKVLGKKTTTIWFDVDIEIDVHTVPVEGALVGQVPPEVDLERADADLVRALMAEGLINRSVIDEVLDDARAEVTKRISNAVGGKVIVRLFLVDLSLDRNSTGPIQIRGSAEVEKEKDIDSLGMVENVIEIGQRFPLLGKDGWKVEYIIGLPEGMRIIKVDHAGTSTTFEERPEVSSDRRTFTETIVDGGRDNVTLYVKPTVRLAAREALGQPVCSIPFILVVVAVTGTVYWYSRRRKARMGRAKGAGKGETIDGYKAIKGHVRARGTRVVAAKPPSTRSMKRTVDEGPVLERPAHGPQARIRKEGGKGQRKNVRCPDCGRRFTVDARYKDIVCPHCGKKGKVPARREQRKVQCPRCKHIIRYRKGETAIRCHNCGKVGKVRADRS